MTLEWLAIHVKIRFRPALLDSERLTFKNNCLNGSKHGPMLPAAKCRLVTLVSGSINYFSKAFLAGAWSNRSGVVEIDEFAVFPLPYISFRNNVRINCTLRRHTVLDFLRHQ